MAKWLHSLGDVNIHILDESPFCIACLNGHLDVAKWLHSLGDVDIRANNDGAFRQSCWNWSYSDWTNVIDWLCILCEDYTYICKGNKYIPMIRDTVEYYAHNNMWDEVINKLQCIKDSNFIIREECIFCYEKANIVTNCNHSYCIRCLVKWYNKPCAYCTQAIQYNHCIYAPD